VNTGKLRVGYVLKRFPRLSETFILNEMLELERQGVEIEIYSLFKPPAEERHALLADLKARVTYLPATQAMDQMTVKSGQANALPERVPLADALGSHEFDPVMPGKSAQDKTAIIFKAATVALLAKASNLQHLHAHFGSDAATVALMASRLSGLPFSFTAHAKDIYHTYDTEVTDRRMRRAKISEAAFVATVSEFNRKHLSGIAGKQNAANIHRLYNGIDLSRFSHRSEGRDPATILAVGRLVEKKGFTYLVDACRILARRSVDFRCDIVGDGPLHSDLAAQISAAQLSGKVNLLGPRKQEQLIDLMQTATIMALPCIVTESGDRDGLPTVLLEALASGLPCVSTTVSGVPEIIDDGENGYLAEPGDAQELADKIAFLLGQPILCAAFARAGRAKAEREFDLSANTAILKGLFAQSRAHTEGGHGEVLLRIS
jgi:colanic acid/amylovoran biosynthesis glycosyltransferase